MLIVSSSEMGIQYTIVNLHPHDRRGRRVVPVQGVSPRVDWRFMQPVFGRDHVGAWSPSHLGEGLLDIRILHMTSTNPWGLERYIRNDIDIRVCMLL